MLTFRKRRETRDIVVHCSATPSKMDIGVKEIRTWHIKRGFVDVGYHYVIRRDGSVETGRPHDTMGAHVRSFNKFSVAVCLVGDANSEDTIESSYTAEQISSLKTVLRQLKELYPSAKICGHRDFPKVGKLCPGFDVKSWVATTDVESTCAV